MREDARAALSAFLLDVVLFILKGAAAITTGSLAVLSSAFDSLNDVISNFLAYYSVRESGKGPDRDHPFGHRRMEPLAAMLIAILAGVLAIEILRTALFNILAGVSQVMITGFAFAVLAITICVKTFAFLMLRKNADKSDSSALEAMSIDARNDVMSNTVAIIGIAGVYYGFPLFDEAAAVVIAIFIGYSGYKVARKNFDYILGARPDDKTMAAIRKKAKVEGVKKVKKVIAHYVGDRVHTEIIIKLSKNTDSMRSHRISEKVRKSVESIGKVTRAFVHIDYE